MDFNSGLMDYYSGWILMDFNGFFHINWEFHHPNWRVLHDFSEG